jgi:Fur family transcriptional regulator, ferric uptake regulator
MNSKQITDIFINFLKRNQQRVTKERLIILENILLSNRHIDADDLFLKLKSHGLKSSRATVYNTLQLLVKSNIITKSSLGETHQHYERAYGLPQHHHLICSNCGIVLEFENEAIEKIKENVCIKNKFNPTQYIFQISGICHKCSKKN